MENVESMESSTLPKLLASGKFSPDDIRVSVSESNRKVDSIIESKLEAVWEEKKKRAEAEGRTLYNGEHYRLNYLEKDGDKLILDFGIFDFKVRDGLINIPKYFDLSEDFYRKGCYSVATVKTADNKYLMVELSGKSMNPHTLEQLGGVMETNIGMRTGRDVFKSLYAELEEEGCIKEVDIKEACLCAVFLAVGTNVAFYFEITLLVSSGELLDRFNKENKDPDIKALKVFSREEYLDELRNHESRNKRFNSEIVGI